MTVLDFCTQRNIQTQTVLKYIQRNPEIFEGHTSKKGQQMEIDDAAFLVLDEKYPIPPEVIPAPNLELLAELDKAKTMIIKLHEEAAAREKLLAKAELDKIMLEERSIQLLEAKSSCTELQSQNSTLHEEIGSLKAQLEAAQQEASRAIEEAERLRGRSFWQRLFNT